MTDCTVLIKMVKSLLIFVAVVYAAEAAQKCHGSPRTYNGKPCASTTNFADGRQGACGCGFDGADKQFDWSKNKYTAAINQHFFDTNNKHWCGHTCGHCFNLTTTGGSAPGGQPTREGQSHVFMVVDLCPNQAPNLEWCTQTAAHPVNRHGYGAHFDLENGAHQITNGLHWDNVEVTYQEVDCASVHNSMTPTVSNWNECECHKLHSGK